MATFLHRAGQTTRNTAIATASGARSFWAGLMGEPDPSEPPAPRKRTTTKAVKPTPKPVAKRTTRK